MGLPNLLAVPQGEQGWLTFWFDHYQDHVDIVQAIQSQKGVSLTIYDIYPWMDTDKEGILQRHQEFHNDMNTTLGIPGNDVSEVDFKKPNEVKAWIYIQYQEHLNAHMALGI